ncbi:phage head closure protein [Clostridioides mangenotii]|uniref:phage head closure protein n=1 Tax=Metaclostridioides mangenotii TaxID=1540 RepID=UPI00214A18A1|nr:phage head closure protein [Clostridioides mangenotii]MCR1955393.1 phage head closure protein [Clostridioides mangenotii]
MRFNRNNGEELNSGILFYGTKETKRDNLGKNPKTKFIDEGRLKFKYKSIREMDYNQYYGISNKLDIKVKAYYVKNIEESHIVQIADDYFDIVKIDYDNERMYMYLYLAKRRSLDD